MRIIGDLLIFGALLVTVAQCANQGGKKPPGQQGHHGRLKDEDIKKLQDQCQRKNCKQQSAKAKKDRAEIKALHVKHLGKKFHGDHVQAEAEAEKTLSAVFQAKKAMTQVMGVQNVDPYDDGLWQKDIVLNQKQAEFLLAHANKKLQATNTTSPISTRTTSKPNIPGGRRKRDIINVAQFPNYKWSLPIAYFIGPGWGADEQTMISGALQEIQSKTCITFQAAQTEPAGPHMLFTKSAAQCGGCAPVGMQSADNEIVMSLAGCGDPNLGHQIAVHEILHSLGMQHEQSRTDRDQFITVLWANVDPQQTSNFYEDTSMFSSYGVPYNYLSIMHYNQAAFSINGQPTMQPLQPGFADKIGNQQTMAATDATLLKQIYCTGQQAPPTTMTSTVGGQTLSMAMTSSSTGTVPAG